MDDTNSHAEKHAPSRRNFLDKGMKVGLQIVAGAFAFLPAANALAKELSSNKPTYVPCQTKVCYAYSCEVPCSISHGGCYCFDARNPNYKCGCGFNIAGQCTPVTC